MGSNAKGFLTNDIASGGASITPSDSQDLPQVAFGVYVGSAGDIAVVTADGSSLTFKNCNSGQFLPVIIRKVLLTGTTASNLIALY